MHFEESPFQLPNHADPLGAALLDYLAGTTDGHIVVHSDITDDEAMSVVHFFRTGDAFSGLEQTALAQCRGRVLDVGAGAGSHALALQARGLEVTALDVSAGAADVMRRRGVRNVCQSDIMHFKGGKFDTLLMLMNGIGLAGTLDGLAAFLEHAQTLLNPGGQILLDSADILYMYEDEEGGYWIDLNGPYHGEVTYQMCYLNQCGEPFPWLFVSYDLLAEYAAAAGYTCECLFTDENEQFLARLTALPRPSSRGGR